MDNEKYGIELELVTDSFNRQIDKVKEQAKSVKKAFDPNDISSLKINGRPWQEYGEEVEKVNKKTRELISITKGTQIAPKYDQSALNFIDNYGVKQEQTAQKTKKTTENVKELNRETKKTGKGLTLDGFNKGLEKMTSKIRRFGLSLLSIRSIWSLVSRASSAYLAQDTELSNKLQSAWVGLGAMLAPIIERIVDLIAKAVKYINIFIKALTGVDLLAKATAKSMGGTAKSAKSLNKALAGFDELQNLDTQAGGGDVGGIAGGLEALNDVKINTDWADKIRRFGEWVKTNWPEVLASFLGLVTALKVLSPLVEQFGLKLGGIKALGIGLMIWGIVYAVSSLIEYIKNPTFENFGKTLQGIGIAVLGLGLAFLGLPGIIAGAVVLVIGTILRFWDDIKAFFQNGIDWLKEKSDWIHNVFGEGIGSIYDFFIETLQNGLNFFDAMFTSIKGQFDGIIQFIEGVFTGDWEKAWDGVKKGFSAWWEGIKKMFKTGVIDMGKSVGNLIVGALKAVVNGILSQIEYKLNAPIRAINTLLDLTSQFTGISFGRIGTFNLPRLNTGTNYVPEDQIAMIHRGEAVVPKKFNSKEYFESGNEETNALLEEVIEAVRSIEINPYTTIKDVGKASLSYINNKSRQLGESVVV